MEQNQSKGLSIAALVCGILSIVGDFIPVINYFTFVLAIVAIVLGAMAMKKANENNEPKGMAIAGLVLGIVALAFAVLAIICVAIACAAVASTGLYY